MIGFANSAGPTIAQGRLLRQDGALLKSNGEQWARAPPEGLCEERGRWNARRMKAGGGGGG